MVPHLRHGLDPARPAHARAGRAPRLPRRRRRAAYRPRGAARRIAFPSTVGVKPDASWHSVLLSALVSELIRAGDPAWDNAHARLAPRRVRCRMTIETVVHRLMRGPGFTPQRNSWLEFEEAFREVRSENSVEDGPETIPDTPISRRANGPPRRRYEDSFPGTALFEKKPAAKNMFPSATVTLVLPCAGRSTGFPGQKPKWLLTQPNGRLMAVDALFNLDLTHVKRVVVGVLRDHLEEYCGNDPDALLAAFDRGPIHLENLPITLCVIASETADQVQTVECMLRACKVAGPIFIKDCDSSFACPVTRTNGIACLQITPGVQNVAISTDKAYITVDETGAVNNIVENVVLGDTICVGGYSFTSAAVFGQFAEERRGLMGQTACAGTELTVSDVIWSCMTPRDFWPSVSFVPIPVKYYEDWGTSSTWLAFTRTFSTLFVDVDGIIFKNSDQYFFPTWGTQSTLEENVACLQALRRKGRTQIILTTSRPEILRQATETHLRLRNVPYDQLLMGMLNAQRIVVNDYAKTASFPSARAVNVRHDADDLREHLILEP